MKYPSLIASNATQTFALPGGAEVVVPKCNAHFKKWKGVMPQNTYGGKQALDLDGNPLFAELVVLRLFQNEGWQGVWVDTYGKKYRVGLPDLIEPVELPSAEANIVIGIASRAGGFKGCWDVFLWKGDEHMFVELKRASKDAIRETQERWLEASLDLGFPSDAFLVVEWDTEQ